MGVRMVQPLSYSVGQAAPGVRCWPWPLRGHSLTEVTALTLSSPLPLLQLRPLPLLLPLSRKPCAFRRRPTPPVAPPLLRRSCLTSSARPWCCSRMRRPPLWAARASIRCCRQWPACLCCASQPGSALLRVGHLSLCHCCSGPAVYVMLPGVVGCAASARVQAQPSHQLARSLVQPLAQPLAP